jgi:hypothetical protein
MAGAGNGYPQPTWAVVIAAAGVLCLVVGGGYAIIQNQFKTMDDKIESNRRDIGLALSLREHAAYQHEQEGVNTQLRARLVALENEQRELLGHAAHNPVESKEVDGLSASVDKRIELVQQQINDINRQIAASVLQGFAAPHLPPH